MTAPTRLWHSVPHYDDIPRTHAQRGASLTVLYLIGAFILGMLAMHKIGFRLLYRYGASKNVMRKLDTDTLVRLRNSVEGEIARRRYRLHGKTAT